MVRQLRGFPLLCLGFLIGLPVASPDAVPERPAKEIKALLVDGRPAKDPLDQATGFLRIALNPFEDKAPPEVAKVHVKVVSVAEFGDLGAKDLEAWHCVFLCDVPRL